MANNSVTRTVAATSTTARLSMDAKMSFTVFSRSFGSFLNRLASNSCSQHANSWHFVSDSDMSVAVLKVFPSPTERRPFLSDDASCDAWPVNLRGPLSPVGCCCVRLLGVVAAGLGLSPLLLHSLPRSQPGNSQLNDTTMVDATLGLAYGWCDNPSCIMKKTPRSTTLFRNDDTNLQTQWFTFSIMV